MIIKTDKGHNLNMDLALDKERGWHVRITDAIDRKPLSGILEDTYGTPDDAYNDIQGNMAEIDRFLSNKDYLVKGKKSLTDDGERMNHPSYGTIRVSRITGGAQPLFGSALLHRDRIRMSIQHAQVSHELSTDWILPENSIIEIDGEYF